MAEALGCYHDDDGRHQWQRDAPTTHNLPQLGDKDMITLTSIFEYSDTASIREYGYSRRSLPGLDTSADDPEEGKEAFSIGAPSPLGKKSVHSFVVSKRDQGACRAARAADGLAVDPTLTRRRLAKSPDASPQGTKRWSGRPLAKRS